jgi:hypothetical protein
MKERVCEDLSDFIHPSMKSMIRVEMEHGQSYGGIRGFSRKFCGEELFNGEGVRQESIEFLELRLIGIKEIFNK